MQPKHVAVYICNNKEVCVGVDGLYPYCCGCHIDAAN